MKERPILFNTDMVQAIDAGTKTMTRRIAGQDWINNRADDFTCVGIFNGDNESVLTGFRGKSNPLELACVVLCPFGKVGDLLWVRETWAKSGWEEEEVVEPAYKALNHKHMCGGWRPSIHMPKDAARIWLKITDISVERLLDISETDAVMEGIKELSSWPEAPDKKIYQCYGYPKEIPQNMAATFDPKVSFFTLWESINGSGSVKRNPWVWVISFEKLEVP